MTGTSVVIPKHVKYQGEYAEVGFVNVNNQRIDEIENQLDFNGNIAGVIDKFGGADLVVFHETYIKEYLKISSYLRRKNIPYVIVPHGCLTKSAQRIKPIKKKIGNMVFSSFLRGAAAVQCLSENEAKNFAFKKYNKKFIGTNGVVTPSRRKEKFNETKTDFVFIGRLMPYIKGIDLLLDAVSKIKDYLIKNGCRFDIYGPFVFGWNDQIQAMIDETGLNDLVKLHDKVSGAEKENILLNSDIFIQTSRSEGMPLGILEALSYGLPVLVTEGTNVTNFVSKYQAGFVCDNDADSIANAIEKAVSERENFRTLSTSAINLVKENFDWALIARKAVEDYRKIIDCEFLTRSN